MGPQLTSIGPKTSPSFTRGLCQVLTDLLDVKIYNMCRPTQICLNFQFRPFFYFPKILVLFIQFHKVNTWLNNGPPSKNGERGTRYYCVREKKNIVYGREQEFQFQREDQAKKLWLLRSLTKSDLLVLGGRTWVLRRLSLPGGARLLSASRRLFMTISNYGKVIKPLE